MVDNLYSEKPLLEYNAQGQSSSVKADSHITCRAHAATMPFPCHAVPLRIYNVSFPFDLHSATVSDSHLPCRAHTMPCRGLEKNGMIEAWHGHGMASVNQTRQHCANQIGKTHSKLLAARHENGMLCVNRPLQWCQLPLPFLGQLCLPWCKTYFFQVLFKTANS